MPGGDFLPSPHLTVDRAAGDSQLCKQLRSWPRGRSTRRRTRGARGSGGGRFWCRGESCAGGAGRRGQKSRFLGQPETAHGDWRATGPRPWPGSGRGRRPSASRRWSRERWRRVRRRRSLNDRKGRNINAAAATKLSHRSWAIHFVANRGIRDVVVSPTVLMNHGYTVQGSDPEIRRRSTDRLALKGRAR